MPGASGCPSPGLGPGGLLQPRAAPPAPTQTRNTKPRGANSTSRKTPHICSRGGQGRAGQGRHGSAPSSPSIRCGLDRKSLLRYTRHPVLWHPETCGETGVPRPQPPRLHAAPRGMCHSSRGWTDSASPGASAAGGCACPHPPCGGKGPCTAPTAPPCSCPGVGMRRWGALRV